MQGKKKREPREVYLHWSPRSGPHPNLGRFQKFQYHPRKGLGLIRIPRRFWDLLCSQSPSCFLRRCPRSIPDISPLYLYSTAR